MLHSLFVSTNTRDQNAVSSYLDCFMVNERIFFPNVKIVLKLHRAAFCGSFWGKLVVFEESGNH